MKALFTVALLLASISLFAKDTIQVEVKNTHAVTHEARDTRALVEKGIVGSGTPNRQVESYNLDAVINGEHVLLECVDPKGCESPAPGSYDGEMKRRGRVRLSFEVPVTHAQVTRWYKIAGSW